MVSRRPENQNPVEGAGSSAVGTTVPQKSEPVALVNDGSIEQRLSDLEARVSRIETRVNPRDESVGLQPEKKNYNPDYLPHGVEGVKGLRELPPKIG